MQDEIVGFDARGIRLAAISVDPPEINRGHGRKLRLTYDLLSDPGAATIRRYDLVHAGAGPGGADIARPAMFLLDPAGIVRWRSLTHSYAVRVRPERVLQAADDLGLTAANPLSR